MYMSVWEWGGPKKKPIFSKTNFLPNEIYLSQNIRLVSEVLPFASFSKG